MLLSSKFPKYKTDVDLKPDDILETIELIVNLVNQVKNNSFANMKDDLLLVTGKIGNMVFPDNQNVGKLLRSLLLLIYGEYDHIDPIVFSFLNINESQFKTLKTLMVSFTQILKAPGDFISSHSNMLLKSFTEKNSSVVKRLTDKLQSDEKLSNQDLFKSFDIDQSGQIDLEEFKTLTRRLGMDLSEHRIIEIFTSVKSNLNVNVMELDEKEFEAAMGYLHNKTLNLILDYLGISKEFLMWMLVWLCLILLVIFAFIFVGIAAFALGGTFGAVVNSLFPICIFRIFFEFLNKIY